MTLPLGILHREVEEQLGQLSEAFTDNWEGVKGNGWDEAEVMAVYWTVKEILTGESSLDLTVVSDNYQRELDEAENTKMVDMMEHLRDAGYDVEDVGLLNSFLVDNKI